MNQRKIMSKYRAILMAMPIEESLKGDLLLDPVRMVQVVQAFQNTREVKDMSERMKRVMELVEKGLGNQAIAEKTGLSAGTVATYKNQAKKKAVGESSPSTVKEVKPLREKDVRVAPISEVKKPKSPIQAPVEDKPNIDTLNVNDSLKKRNLDLQKQLDRFREIEKNMQLELIEQKHAFEKLIANERAEKEKAYADYTSEVENSKRLRQQVQDLLMVDGLNEGLMQQNLMFRKRFGMLQEGAQL